MGTAQEQTYTIKQAAEQTGISVDTIRYYEKIALLPPADRKPNGHRFYGEKDLYALRMITCLKKTGMALEDMRPFLAVSENAGPAEHPELMEQIMAHRQHVIELMASLQQVVDFIDMKMEEGTYKPNCSNGEQHEGAAETAAETRVSRVQLAYFARQPGRT